MANVDLPQSNINREARLQQAIAQDKNPKAGVAVYERGSANSGIRVGKPQTNVRRAPAYGRSR